MTNFLAVTGVDADAEPQLWCFALQTEDTQEPLNTIALDGITEAVDGANPEAREDSTEFICDGKEAHDILRGQICDFLESEGHTVKLHLGEVAIKGEESIFVQLYS